MNSRAYTVNLITYISSLSALTFQKGKLSLAISHPHPTPSGCWITDVHQQAILNPFTAAFHPSSVHQDTPSPLSSSGALPKLFPSLTNMTLCDQLPHPLVFLISTIWGSLSPSYTCATDVPTSAYQVTLVYLFVNAMYFAFSLNYF